jgi:subtilisin-like proprotein convertase family protein
MALAGVGPAYAAPITINESGPASPYPSTLDVAPEDMVIENVEVRITDLVHDLPDELDIALTGPGDRTVMLMSDVGAGGTCTEAPDLRFSMQATGQVPAGALCAGTYLPTDHDPEPGDPDEGDTDLFAGPTPAEPFDTTLSVFNGLLVGGRWNLRVMDDTDGDGGSIAGWSLHFDKRLPARAVIRATSIAVPESQPVLTVTVDRNSSVPGAVLSAAAVDWAVLPDPCVGRAQATLGQDFASSGGSMAFAPGQAAQFFDVTLLDDRVPEATECFRVALTGRSGDARLSATLPEVLQVTLSDDDPRATAPAIAPGRPQRILRTKAITVRATSAADGTLSATGRIALPAGAARTVPLKAARPVAVTGGQRVALKLRLTRTAARTIKRALARRKTLVATIKVTATDLAGGKASRTVKVRLRR